MNKTGAAVIVIALLSGCSTRGNLKPQELTSLREQLRVLNVQESRCSNFGQYAADELLKAFDEDQSACEAKCATLDEAYPGAEARVFDLMALHQAEFELGSKYLFVEESAFRHGGKKSAKELLDGMVHAGDQPWTIRKFAAAARQENVISDGQYLAYIKATMTASDHHEARTEACQQTIAECAKSVVDPAAANACEQKYGPGELMWFAHPECVSAARSEGPIEEQVRKRLEGEDPRWKAAQESVLKDSIDKVEPEPPETRCRYLSDQIRELDSRIYYGDPANCAGPCWMVE